jgi:hypothetical protein
MVGTFRGRMCDGHQVETQPEQGLVTLQANFGSRALSSPANVSILHPSSDSCARIQRQRGLVLCLHTIQAARTQQLSGRLNGRSAFYSNSTRH